MASFPFALVTPERTVISGDAEEVSLRSEGGDIAFLAGHVPFIGEVEVGLLRVTLADGSEKVAAVHGGFVEVRTDGEVVLVAGVAELPEEIDVTRAERAQQRAEAGGGDGGDEDEQEAAARRARARLEAAGRLTAS